MSGFWRHYIVGNDVPPWLVALCRAVLGALLLGSYAAVGAWATTNEPKVIIVAFLVSFLGYLKTRGIIEGAIDQRKNGNRGPPE
jgi:hypothetical protein